MRVLRTLIDLLFDEERIQPDQHVSRLHHRTALDHPDDGVSTSDFGFDFRVLGTFEKPLFDYRDEQVATCDRVSQLGTDPGRSGA